MKKVQMILFPSYFFDTSKVDMELEDEYKAMKELGCFDICLFGYDQWFSNNKQSMLWTYTSFPYREKNMVSY